MTRNMAVADKPGPTAPQVPWTSLSHGIGVVVLALCTMTAGVNAASTGAITLAGTVGITCNVTVAPQGPYDALDLTTSPNNLNVAIVTEQCSDPRGYTVTLATANGRNRGRLVGALAGNNNVIRYTMTYGGAAVTLHNSIATVTDVNSKTSGGVAKALSISYTGRASLNPDTYSDTLTFTITGK